ncbi:hypothetical protein [Nannocystis punicea]|uniref:DUF1565 domain-containing protein n=1 Tax=Nannocystis punicea TaxID=2995304 RepID=A0ABY7GVF4_9BACT|nr:hypothetical protein [Nannocystis poenicansa]WAS90938.1 hypothetical protein O0S08_32515 [Nannocystis poenicansa]
MTHSIHTAVLGLVVALPLVACGGEGGTTVTDSADPTTTESTTDQQPTTGGETATQPTTATEPTTTDATTTPDTTTTDATTTEGTTDPGDTTSTGETTDGTTSTGESTTSDESTTSAVSDSEGTTTEETTSGTTTGGDTTEGTTDGTTTGDDTGDVPDFVAECDDDPANPVIVTVTPNVSARFPTITSGLAAASDGSVIEVCPGTYSDKIEVTVDITLRGAGADKTIIDGGGFHFNLGAGDAVVEGFGFTNCNAKVPNGWNIPTSGAISMNDTYGVQESLTVRDCRFFENSAAYGAAIHVSGSNNGGKNPDIYVESSVFENNTATGEGGAIASYGRVHITDSTFVENTAPTGGALALSYGCTGPDVCDIANTVIKKNHATGSGQYEGGGGIFIDDCGLNCLGGLTVTDSDLGFGASEENTNYQDLPEDVLINDDSAPWNRYGWYYNNISFICSNGSCDMP